MDDRLSGLAELSFGFLKIVDLYLGFMILGPWARSSGIGIKFLDRVKYLARQAGGHKLFLAVLSINPKGRAFWERQGFSATGVWRATTIGNKKCKNTSAGQAIVSKLV
ncbi:MAG: GNAT family N-acetyltransferase [Planktomarina sp.]|nr:GNAT family N-acetyltransferase [Planktomarina sp.]